MICHLIPDIIASVHFQLQSGVSAPFFGRAVEHVCQVAWLDGPILEQQNVFGTGFGTHAPVWASASKPAGSNEYVCQADLAFAGSVGVWTVLDVNFSCGWFRNWIRKKCDAMSTWRMWNILDGCVWVYTRVNRPCFQHFQLWSNFAKLNFSQLFNFFYFSMCWFFGFRKQQFLYLNS